MGSGILPALLGILLWNCAAAAGPCRENSECRELAGILVPPCPEFLEIPTQAPGKREFRLGLGFSGLWERLGMGKSSGSAGIAGGSGRESGKRSYSMEHFRWGKPVGRKRRPVKVQPGGNGDSAENSLEFRREEAPEEEEEEEFPEFPRAKRYGGFMRPERPPLVTLFRNAIGKGSGKEGQ